MGNVRDAKNEHGFTLIELMIVVGIVAILAAVVIPNFMSQTTKSKRLTEISAMFAEISVKQDQFKIERSKYMGLASDANYYGTTTCPTAIPTADYNFSTTCSTSGSAWELLRISPTSSALRCQYAITAGMGGTAVGATTFTPPTPFLNSKGAVGAEPMPAGAWWYILAKCDEKAGGTTAEYYRSSQDPKLQKRNEGN